MSRTRLDPAQKKVSFSLAFSPNLIAALDAVRGTKSQSVFVEDWLRQHPQLAEVLAAMNDPGFTPPIARYEQLMDYLLAFYSPWENKQPTIQTTLMIAQKVILLHHTRPDQEVEEMIVAAMEAFWVQERRQHGYCTTHGERLEVILPSIKDYARYFDQVIFREMAKGERQQLQQRFRSLVRGCEAVYQDRMKREHPTQNTPAHR